MPARRGKLTPLSRREPTRPRPVGPVTRFFSLLPTWAWITIGGGVVLTTVVIVGVAASQGVDEVEPVIKQAGR